MHEHMCPLCDEIYECQGLGCEEMQSNVCSKCFLPEDEPQIVKGEE